MILGSIKTRLFQRVGLMKTEMVFPNYPKAIAKEVLFPILEMKMFFLDGARLIFRGKNSLKNSDYHSDMNSDVFESWMESKIFEKIPENLL